jgi:hypothetical protein
VMARLSIAATDRGVVAIGYRAPVAEEAISQP